MKTCEKIIRDTGKLCGRKLSVRISPYDGLDIDVIYSCPIHRYSYSPAEMPTTRTELEEVLQNMLDE